MLITRTLCLGDMLIIHLYISTIVMSINVEVFESEGTKVDVFIHTHNQLKDFLSKTNAVLELSKEYREFKTKDGYTGILYVKLHYNDGINQYQLMFQKDFCDTHYEKILQLSHETHCVITREERVSKRYDVEYNILIVSGTLKNYELFSNSLNSMYSIWTA